MDEGNLPILVDAKTEYTKQLINIISPVVYQGIKLIYNEAKNKSIENEEQNLTLSNFQSSLSEIPKWNQIIITEKYEKVIEHSKCDWLDDLLTAVFVSHTKILTSINTNKNKNKINLQIPKVDFFIHQCYIEVAREFWKNPYLFDDSVNNFEYQRNRRDASQLIESVIAETIRRQLPVKNILKEYLGSEYSEDSNDSIESSNNITNNLRKLVKNEIENCSKEKLSALNIETSKSINDDNSLTKDDLNAFNNTNVEDLDTELEYNKKPIEEKNSEEIIDENGNPIKINKVSKNDLKLDNIDELINNEVDKLELVSHNDFELNAKAIDDNLSKELTDLSKLEEVYIDEKKNTSEANTSNILENDKSNDLISDSNNIEEIKIENNLNTNNIIDKSNENKEENIKLEIKNNLNNDINLEELNLDSLEDLNFDINNLETDTEDNDLNVKSEEENNVKHKEENNVKTIVIDTKQTINDNKEPSLNPETPRKKVFNRYSSRRKKDFSFFSDALSE